MKKLYFYLVGAMLAFVLIGCGNDRSSNRNNGSVGICGAGLVNTQYGCLQQGMCPPGQAQYNNGQCVSAVANQCPAGQVFSSQYGCLSQGQCPMGQGLYNNQCVMADGIQNGMNNGWNTGWNNTGLNNTGWNQNQYYNGYNPYLPQQNYNMYWMNPFYNPYWTPQYYGW